jgi:hypothetical protein
MTYQGTRARPADDESARVFEVSGIRLAADGRVSHVPHSTLPERFFR